MGWLRATGLVILWLVLVPVAILFLALTNLIGSPRGLLYALLVVGPAVPLTWLLVHGRRRHRVWLTISATVTALLVLALPSCATPDYARVRQQADEIAVPPRSVFLGHDLNGNDLCFEGCPQDWLYYAVPSSAEAVTWLNDWAHQQGWARSTLEIGGINAGWCKGDFSLLALPAPRDARPVRPDRTAPPNAERVIVRVGANCR